MLTKDEFIRRILGEAPRTKAHATKPDTGHIVGFDFADDAPDSEAVEDTRFVTPLLQAGFGDGQGIPRATVIRSTDAVARFIPDEVRYWPKTPTRPHHTLLIEANLTHRELLAIPAFKSRQSADLDIAEDAVARLVAEALDGFQRGAEGLDASALKGQKHETLCVVSIIDEREGHTGRLACFGTFNAKTEGLETFFLTEHARTWDRADARERLGLIYERQFKKLGEASWQEAFTTTDERKQAEKLLEVCTKKDVAEKGIQESILDLLDTIARGFGLRKKADAERRLRAFPLPGDHDIGIDSEEREKEYGGTNPFSGVTLRDDHNHLLGYIVYPLTTKSQAEKLRQHLEKHNRFHNVLVVYPDANQASIELWQGREQLTGKLRKGQSHKDAADVVNLLSRFFVVSKAKVRNPAELAQELAYRARYLRRLALRELEDEPEKGPLRDLYNAFKVALVHDQKEEEFADAFAQTITYGLLTARWLGNDQLATTGDRFTRQSALKYLPAASPFLNDLFKSVLSLALDEQRGRLLWLVDDVADLLDRIDVTYVFGDGDRDADSATDPVIHFYEPFLAAYDKDLKNKRGVFFTPRPVVSYIVRTVHEMLKTEFGLEDGLASTDTWADVARRVDGLKLPEGTKPADAFVRVLDPATGTGTFIYECIGVIEKTMKDRWCRELKVDSWSDEKVVARWNEYVPKHLLPRLYGFELMMASYAICHLKLSFKLNETGYDPTPDQRLHVYLTNTLEPSTDVQRELEGISPTLAREARSVNAVKRGVRFLVVIGNPPYSVKSYNNNPWIRGLLADFKKDLNETKLNLDDDFIKFLRYASHQAQATGVGVVCMITNNIFLSGVTHRQMRRYLIETFPRQWVADLHGDSRYGEVAPPGSANENVFDIQQGVCILTLSKDFNGPQRTTKHADVWGTRGEKFTALTAQGSIEHTELHPEPPYYYLQPSALNAADPYYSWPLLTDWMPLFSNGIETHKDALTLHFSIAELKATVEKLLALPVEKSRVELGVGADGRDWRLADAVKSLRAMIKADRPVVTVTYRPFDERYTYLNAESGGFVAYPRWGVMASLTELDGNVGLVSARLMARGGGWDSCFVTQHPTEKKTGDSTRSSTLFPLFVKANDSLPLGERSGVNLSPRLLKDAEALMTGGIHNGKEPDAVFNYIYAVLYSPSYRLRYIENLKGDFPRIPFPPNVSLLLELARCGRKLRSLHLMDPSYPSEAVASYAGPASPEVEKISYTDSSVWLDKRRTYGFGNIPAEIWEFRIGGYQICEKWLKDRKGRALSKDEIARYCAVVGAIAETLLVMEEVDEVVDEHGGWPAAFSTEASAS